MNEITALLAGNELLENIIIGIIGAIILKLLHFIYKKIVNYIYLNNHFSISGMWIAEFDSYIKDKKNIEIVNIKQTKEAIVFYQEQYNSLSPEIRKFRGKGIFRGAELTSIYFPISKSDIQNGALILRITHVPGNTAYLSGIYAEFTSSNNISDIKKGNYSLQRFDMPFSQKFIRFIGGSYFKDYEEILNYKNDLRSNSKSIKKV